MIHVLPNLALPICMLNPIPNREAVDKQIGKRMKTLWHNHRHFEDLIVVQICTVMKHAILLYPIPAKRPVHSKTMTICTSQNRVCPTQQKLNFI